MKSKSANVLTSREVIDAQIDKLSAYIGRLNALSQSWDWTARLLKKVEHNGPLKQKLDKAIERGANRGIVCFLVKNVAIPANVLGGPMSIQTLVGEFKANAASLREILQAVRRLAEKCRRLQRSTTGTLKEALEELTEMLNWNAVWLAAGEKQFKGASSARTLRDRDFRFDLLVTYMETSTRRAHYDLISELMESAYLVTGSSEAVSADQLKMRVRRFRERHPKLHQMAAAQVKTLVKTRATLDVQDITSPIQRFVFSESNTKLTK